MGSEFIHQEARLELLFVSHSTHCLVPCQGLVTYDAASRNIALSVNYVLTTKCHLENGWEIWQRHCSYISKTGQGLVSKPLGSAAIFDTSRTTLVPSPFDQVSWASPHQVTIPSRNTHWSNRHFLRALCRQLNYYPFI